VFKCEHTTGPDLWHNESGRCIEVTLGANKWHVLPEDVAALKAFRRNHRVRANDYFAVLPRDMTRDEWMAWMHQGIVPGPLLTFVP
jgi:hypothetical protein